MAAKRGRPHRRWQPRRASAKRPKSARTDCRRRGCSLASGLATQRLSTRDSTESAWADTTTPHGRLILTVLGGLAEFERELIRARTADGRDRAKARGVHMGRPAKLTLHQQREALERRANGETLVDIARTFNVSHTTISRLSP
jgi:DNA invertase Pin-like site-specific DNA recombinase